VDSFPTPSAWHDWLRTYARRFLLYARQQTRSAADAEDVLQDVFVIVHRKIRWLREPQVFRPWLYRIATRAAIRRGHGERTRLDQPADNWAWLARVADDDEMSERVLLGQDAMAAIVGRVQKLLRR